MHNYTASILYVSYEKVNIEVEMILVLINIYDEISK